MKIAILLNGDHSRFRTLAKNTLAASHRLIRGIPHGPVILPEYDSFARILDPSPVVLGTGDRIDWSALRHCDLLIWEWGWTDAPARTVLEIHSRLDIPLLMFPGPLDRFWREMKPEDFRIHLEAVAASDAVGVMLRDTCAFYGAVAPSAHVFHMPVPVDVKRFAAFAVPPAARDRNQLLLTAPTRFSGPASQLPIAAYVAFKKLLEKRPRLRGMCFTYSEDEGREAAGILRDLGLAPHVDVRSYVRPIFRYCKQIAPCFAGLTLPHGLLQGRSSLITACLRIPMVISDEVETHRLLYPHTTVKWHDVDAAVERCLRLLDDEGFHEEVAREARVCVGYYSVEQCRQRMIDGIEAGLARRSTRRHAG